jgi:hypothetical protein
VLGDACIAISSGDSVPGHYRIDGIPVGRYTVHVWHSLFDKKVRLTDPPKEETGVATIYVGHATEKDFRL